MMKARWAARRKGQANFQSQSFAMVAERLERGHRADKLSIIRGLARCFVQCREPRIVIWLRQAAPVAGLLRWQRQSHPTGST